MGKTAVIIPAKADREAFSKKISRAFPERTSENDYYFFSNVGSHFNVTNDITRPAHIYATLDSSFSQVLIVKEFPVLYANDFTVCWLASMLLDMKQGAKLWIEIENEKTNERKNLITSGYLKEKLPGARVQKASISSDWYKITNAGNLASDIQTLKTTYRFLHRKFRDFKKIYNLVNGDICIGGNRTPNDKALRTYIYSLFGANQKSFIIERIISEHLGKGGDLNGIDIGGGYGFMAAELAAKGHFMVVVDHSPGQINVVGKWLVEQCRLEDRLTLKVDTIENTHFFEGKYDFVCFFGCLLTIDRKNVPSVLREATKLLRPSGLLLIHENPKEAGKPGTLQYEERFEAYELYKYLIENAGEPIFYSMFTGDRTDFESIKNKVIMAVVRK